MKFKVPYDAPISRFVQLFKIGLSVNYFHIGHIFLVSVNFFKLGNKLKSERVKSGEFINISHRNNGLVESNYNKKNRATSNYYLEIQIYIIYNNQ